MKTDSSTGMTYGVVVTGRRFRFIPRPGMPPMIDQMYETEEKALTAARGRTPGPSSTARRAPPRGATGAQTGAQAV